MGIKKVLVTGSEGYIGSVLVKELLKKGYEVDGFDTCFYKDGKDDSRDYTFIKGDIRSLDSLPLDKYDAVIHLAALSNDPSGDLNPLLTEEINYKSSIALAKKAKKSGVKRFLFSSSCSIYGIAENGVVDETSKVNPLTAYARSKIMTEDKLKELSDPNFFVGLLRNSTVYGYSPMFRNDLVVNNFVTCALALNQIKIMSDGTPWRPLIDVRDLSNIFMAFLETNNPDINANVINIGFNENNFQVRDLLNEVHKQLPKCEIKYTGEHGKDSRSYKVNFDKFKNYFPDVQKKWPLDKSIKDMINNLTEIKYSKEDFINEKFVRLRALKNLLENKKINNDLYWI